VSTEGLDPSILLPALAAGLLVLATHVPLGQEVLRRGIIFIDLAIAQIAGLGVVVAYSAGLESTSLALQLAALASALAAALFFYYSEQWWPQIQEAVIGSAFVLAATAMLLLLATEVHGAEHLKELLVGQILWVAPAQLAQAALPTLLVLLAWFGRWWKSENLRFYFLFALAVTVAVQLVGVYLVFATLIIPALTVRHLAARARLWVAYAIGAAGYALGLALSALFDLPSGAVIVWAIALAALPVNFMLRARRSAL
jgi:zinc/manganese transport system permease protein